MKNIWITVVSGIFIFLTLMSCTQGVELPEIISENSTKDVKENKTLEQKDVTDDGHDICGSNTPVYTEYPPLSVPSYSKRSSAVYNYKLDDSVDRFSPRLAEWVIKQIQQSMNGFESEVKIAEIYERTATWKVTSLAHNVANVEYSLFTKSSRAPEGVTVRNTYLYNRSAEIDYEIQDLFLDRKVSEEKLKQILVDELLKLRADNLEVSMQSDDLLSDTLEKLPDGIFGYLDVELFQSENSKEFGGLKISIDDKPPWNWFPESGYEVIIDAMKFSSSLKPKCKTLFSNTF